MIWQALAQRGQAKRTLIITPAGLTTQWQEELQDKFGATFEIFGRDFHSVNPRIWAFKTHAIASLDRLKRPEHKSLLLENRKWDLIIFDEAHRLSALDYGSGKVEKTLNYRLAEEVGKKQYSEAFLLLTATPHQGEENHSREMVEGEIALLERLLAQGVKRDRKLDELLRLIDHIAKESGRGQEEKVLIFTEYRETQRHLVSELEGRYGKGSVVVIHGGMKLERQGESEQEVQALWAPFARDGALGAAR
jgi:SNF2 family DNA or RNA helicase